MKPIILMVVAGTLSLLLTGCERIKSTPPDPFYEEPESAWEDTWSEPAPPDTSFPEEDSASSVPEPEPSSEAPLEEQSSSLPDSDSSDTGQVSMQEASGQVPLSSGTPPGESSIASAAESSSPVVLPPETADPQDAPLSAARMEQELYRLINESREAQGTAPLASDSSLAGAARIRAGEAVNSFSHTRPDGSGYHTAMDETGFVYAGKVHGENLSSMSFSLGMYNEEEAAWKMFRQLSESSGHNLNMMNPDFVFTGIGVYVEAGGGQSVRIGMAQLFSG